MRENVHWIQNKPAVILLFLTVPVTLGLGLLFAIPILPYILSLGPAYLGAAIIFSLILIMGAYRTFLYHTIGFGSDRVIFKGILKTIIVSRDEVERVTFSLPIESDDPQKIDWWGGPRSLLTIQFRNGRKMESGFIVEGLQLRIARVLDPKNHPS